MPYLCNKTSFYALSLPVKQQHWDRFSVFQPGLDFGSPMETQKCTMQVVIPRHIVGNHIYWKCVVWVWEFISRGLEYPLWWDLFLFLGFTRSNFPTDKYTNLDLPLFFCPFPVLCCVSSGLNSSAPQMFGEGGSGFGLGSGSGFGSGSGLRLGWG